MYAREDDPWHFATSDYEARKYAVSLASLPRSRYHSGFEPGCSNGVLSEMLATRCDYLLACDLLEDVVSRAELRLAHAPHVRVEQRAIPHDWPDEAFDLVVLSEIAYYFDEATLGELMGRVRGSSVEGADVLAVHWRGATDYPLSGVRAHEIIARTRGLRSLVHHEDEQFVLDVWRVKGRR
jgi:hypothetical protein